MTLATLAALAGVALETATRLHELLDKCISENRNPTPEELAAVKLRQREAEQEWAELAPK